MVTVISSFCKVRFKEHEGKGKFCSRNTLSNHCIFFFSRPSLIASCRPPRRLASHFPRSFLSSFVSLSCPIFLSLPHIPFLPHPLIATLLMPHTCFSYRFFVSLSSPRLLSSSLFLPDTTALLCSPPPPLLHVSRAWRRRRTSPWSPGAEIILCKKRVVCNLPGRIIKKGFLR